MLISINITQKHDSTQRLITVDNSFKLYAATHTHMYMYGQLIVRKVMLCIICFAVANSSWSIAVHYIMSMISQNFQTESKCPLEVIICKVQATQAMFSNMFS